MTESGRSEVIATRGLTKRYGPRVGVEEVSLAVPRGSVFGFIGPNGAGKTTTIRLLLGFLRANAGTASVFGLDCWRDSHRIKRDVGYLPGDLRLAPWMTATSALRIVGAARGSDLTPAGQALTGRFDLDPGVRVRSMSRGMRQKLGLILALSHEPNLLVLDEPTSALDPVTQERLYDYLAERSARGVTVFFSSHVLSEVEGLCDRVAIVRAGRIVVDDTLADLKARARRVVTLSWEREPDRGSAPSFLTLRDGNDSTWRCELEGPAAPLLDWLQGKRLRDLTVGAPDLDSLFRRYYTDAGEQ